MPTYRSADDLGPMLAEVMKAYHPDLLKAGVTVGVLYAHAPRDPETGEPKGPALKLHGAVAAAVVKIRSQKDRVAGLPDAEVVVDGDRWEEWPGETQRALLDHELEHLVLVLDEDGNVKLDDCHRPKLKTKPHDHEIGIFESVVNRHGAVSLDAQAYKPLHQFMSQKTFPWG